MSRLIVWGQEGQPNHVVEFEGQVLTIGRSSENHLQIDDLNSSRHHCEIHEQEGRYELIDKNSRNGVFVNGHRVARQVLESGDKIEIGTTIIYFDEVPEVHERAGKETVDISTGVFSAVGDPTGVKAVLSSVLDTARLPPRVGDAVRRRDADETDPGRTPLPVSEQPTPAPSAPPPGELRDLRQLLALNRTFNAIHNLRRVLETVMDTVISVSGAERGFLILIEGEELKVKVSRNIDQESIRDAREKISQTLVKEALTNGRSVLLTDAANDARYGGKQSILNMKLRSVLVVPLRHRERALGAIYLDNRFALARFDQVTQERVELVSDSAAVAIENARLFEENVRQQEELRHAKEELERLNQLLRERVEVQDRQLVRAREALAARREELTLRYSYDHIVTASPKMLEVFSILDKVTDSNVPVLIQGESGTGKELIARALHFNGPRKKARFVSENCAAIPTNLMESEFFGYVKGAFTGATADKMGLFEMADQGTLFLDEIGDMDLDMQTKLLRVLQDGVLRRVGSKEFKRVNARIVSATNKDLLAFIKDGRFREDLYYRLNVINVLLPPLRERKEDVPLLAEHFLKQGAKQSGQGSRTLTDEALDLFLRYDWPGNIRELENEIMRASAMSKDEIRPEHLSRSVVEGARAPGSDAGQGGRIRGFLLSGKTLKELVAEETDLLESQVIAEVLRRTGYKKSKSAQVLGISRPTLDAKIDKHKLSKDRVLSDD
ncbi:MAG: sigma 54-interacting transcriptional regulator [Planctomycetota bacterium]